jgi:putative DNA primase/helicase
MSQSVRDLAIGRWPDLLVHFGIERHHLTGKHAPCPACGGIDRFRFDDKDGRGTWFCSKCGAGDGFALLGLVKGWRFKQAATEVEAIVGTITATASKPSPSHADKLEACRRIWLEARAVIAGDPVARYLERRCGIDIIPDALRYHAALPYWHDDGCVTKHPAMLAKVADADGKGCAIHRTYLTVDGQKAAVSSPKKIIGNLPPGAAVRLSPPAECIGIAEGIETALAASVRFGAPAWAAISALGLERWTPPTGTSRVLIFADNDMSYTGQAAAFTLARRLHLANIVVEVLVPDQPGSDWAENTNRD